jgi:Fe-S-cluster-containing dehydrogenase component
MLITVEVERCVGCRLCELACSFARHGHFNPDEAGIHVTFEDDGSLAIAMDGSCSDCRRPLCVAFCPVGAIKGPADAGRDKRYPVQNVSAGEAGLDETFNH